MTRTDLEVANDFVHGWVASPKQRRGRLGRRLPVAAVKLAALNHSDLAIRRFCLFLLDHYASDVSSEIVRRALRDPVASVRESALHGLACERCRHEDICVTEVVTDVIETLASDPSPEVRHKAIAALARFIGRDDRAGEAIACAAHHDSDAAIRRAAQVVADSGQP
jgi:hypothetical protein